MLDISAGIVLLLLNHTIWSVNLVLIQLYTILTYNCSVNCVMISHTWCTIPPTYSSSFLDLWIVQLNPPTLSSQFCMFCQVTLNFTFFPETNPRFRYKYCVASASTLDTQDSKGENVGSPAHHLLRFFMGVFSIPAKGCTQECLLWPVYGTNSRAMVPLYILSWQFMWEL